MAASPLFSDSSVSGWKWSGLPRLGIASPLSELDLFPLVVTRDDKNKYIDALEAADKGELKPLVDLFASFQRTQFRTATALSENILTAGTDVATMMSNSAKSGY